KLSTHFRALVALDLLFLHGNEGPAAEGLFPSLLEATEEPVGNSMGGAEDQADRATQRSGCDQLACTLLITELAGDVGGAFQRPVVTIIDWFADATGDDATSESANQSERSLDNPVNRLRFVVQRKSGGYSRTQHKC